MPKSIDLEKHVSILSAQAVEDIVRPLRESFDIRFFRYLKLYKNGKRIVLSNVPDAIRYMYGENQYTNLWYDGEFPDFLKPGWHTWQINRLLDTREIEEKIENDLISLLGVYHGLTLVQENDGFYEIFSFDSAYSSVYKIDKKVLMRFVYYFKDQARKLIQIGERDSLILPIQNRPHLSQASKQLIDFLNNIKINRYYLGSVDGNAYLTRKEAICVRWMIEGKTADEIAVIENTQAKTIQRHIENIKTKFNCTKQTQVIQLLLKAGLYEKDVCF